MLFLSKRKILKPKKHFYKAFANRFQFLSNLPNINGFSIVNFTKQGYFFVKCKRFTAAKGFAVVKKAKKSLAKLTVL